MDGFYSANTGITPAFHGLLCHRHAQVSSKDTSSPAKYFMAAPSRCLWRFQIDDVLTSRQEQPPTSGLGQTPITPSVSKTGLQAFEIAQRNRQIYDIYQLLRLAGWAIRIRTETNILLRGTSKVFSPGVFLQFRLDFAPTARIAMEVFSAELAASRLGRRGYGRRDRPLLAERADTRFALHFAGFASVRAPIGAPD